MAHPNHLQDAHVLVFGGTSGIGYAIANMALYNGAHVTISGSNTSKLEASLVSLRSNYPSLSQTKLDGFACDLSDTPNLEANLREVFEKATQGGQRKVDHITITAGGAPSLVQLADVEIDHNIKPINMRLLSCILISKLLASNPGHYMPISSHSSFTLTSGSNTSKPRPGWSLEATWGAAMEGLTRGLAVDLKPIRVNCVSMYAVDTPLLQAVKEHGGEGVIRELVDQTLVGELARPESTAEAYGWCMRDRLEVVLGALMV
ncbi:NAD(P)-binding protein [Curvularia clavata]|uniref:NAD(P)-binding protein n=1 Tax=Curvularia clavata TaxID=95742 RepID=A0A9Q8Z556_CURCL|nr:NAD(P)-binding protein [Curvularia clavata]